MKKLFIAITVIICGPRWGFADSTIASGDQFIASFLNHVIAVDEFTTKGEVKTQFLDGIIQAGHYKQDYILAIDGGVSNNLAPNGQGKLAATWGAHAHIISFLNAYLNINPGLAQTLSLLEVTPRWSYDADVRKGVLGICFGARIPFN